MVSHRERYEDIVLRTKPVLYVPLQGQGTGSGVLEVIRNVRCTASNVAGYRTGPFPGCYARDFNGTTSEIVVPTNAAYHPGNTFSVGGWWRRDGSSLNGHTFLHNGTGDFVLYINTSNFLTLRRAGTGDIFVSTATYTATDWFHVMAVKNAGTSTTVYVNGVAISGTFTNQTVVGAATAPTIGQVSAGAANWLDGSATHVGIWNRVLSLAEVKELYQAGRDQT